MGMVLIAISVITVSTVLENSDLTHEQLFQHYAF